MAARTPTPIEYARMERRRLPLSSTRGGMIAFFACGLIGFAAAVWAMFRWAPFEELWWAPVPAGLIAFIGSLLLYAWLHPFRCPRCGRKLGRRHMLGAEPGEMVRFVCPSCQIEWDTGRSIPTGD